MEFEIKMDEMHETYSLYMKFHTSHIYRKGMLGVRHELTLVLWINPILFARYHTCVY